MSDVEKLQNLRHSLAHLLAAAVLELWPDTKRAIGPAIENGFYYDFEFKTPISDDDLPKIEKRMKDIIKTWGKFERREVSSEEAMDIFADNLYKLELVNEYANDGLTTYTSGKYIDLCRGGHVEDASEININAFKLTHMAGAYWRGDEKNKMLTRIYGVAFHNRDELDDYLSKLEEAKKRDHKKLGVELDLFTFSDLIGAGLPLFTPKGTLLRDLLDNFVWQLRKDKGYHRVDIPHITKKDLYEKSGHWDKFKDELFKIETREGHIFAMKPMNCPHHTQIFKRKPHSYRELPQRFANTTKVYRDEQTGELAGLSRVRSITQDDAHVFCRYDQVEAEIGSIWDIVSEFYGAAGFPLEVTLSLHDPDQMDKYLGDHEVWQKAEKQLRSIIKQRGVEAKEFNGEAAFYGPKIDFIAQDSLGRKMQVATIQLDMNLPERFDLTCINENGEKERIVMIHAAIMGSIERYMSVLIEHFSGAFPVWLAPIQVKVLPIADRHSEYATEITNVLSEKGIRTEVDDRTESIGRKIRDAEIEKIPYLLVVGDKESESKTVSVRERGEGDTGSAEVDEFTKKVLEEISFRSL